MNVFELKYIKVSEKANKFDRIMVLFNVKIKCSNRKAEKH